MLFLAATATHLTATHTEQITATGGPFLLSTAGLILSAAVITLGYAFTCWIWPFKPCRTCSGTGKKRAPFSARALRIHGRCNGTGLRLRTGRRIYEYLRTQRRNAHSTSVYR